MDDGSCVDWDGLLCDGKYDDAHIDSLSNDQKKEYFRAAAGDKLAVRKTIRDYLKTKISGVTKAEKRQAMIQNRFEVDESDLRNDSYQLYNKKPFLLVAPETGDSTNTSDCHLDLSEEPDNERHIIYPSGVGNYAYLCNNGQFIARQGEQAGGIMYTQCWDGDIWSDTDSQRTEEGGVGNIVCNGFEIGIGSMSSKCETSEPCVDCAGKINGDAVVDACGVCDGDNSTCKGCTNSAACNYDASATVDDDCKYATGCDRCSGETDGTGTVEAITDADADDVCDHEDPCIGNCTGEPVQVQYNGNIYLSLIHI